jgi:hypothetical protein
MAAKQARAIRLNDQKPLVLGAVAIQRTSVSQSIKVLLLALGARNKQVT